jgi:cobalt-zinc-cadmium efflux system outer membrane protein
MKTPQIGYWGFLGALAVFVSGCAPTSEQTAFRTLKAENAARNRAQVDGATYSRRQLPELDAASTLNSYLAYAALNNPQLEAAFNRWKAALEMVAPAHTLPDPRFNYGYFIQEVETRVGPQEHRVGLSQVFPWFGKLRLRGEAALEGANAIQQQYEEARLRLFDEVKQAYYDLYYLGRAVSVTAENVELVQQLEKVAEAKYTAGTALHADVIKAQVELDKLRDRLRTLQDLKNPTTARLNAALNRPVDAPLPFPRSLSPGTLPVATDQLIARLKASNPQLKRLDFQAEKEKANVALAKKEFYPDITLGLDYVETGRARLSGVADSGKDPVIAGFSVNIPLWWGKYHAEVRGAESRYFATREARQNLANQLSTRLKLALFKFQDAERKIALYRDALVPKADENLKVIQRSYETGKADFLSLIDAQRVLLEFQLAYERAVADREQGLATLEKLTGEEPPPLATRKDGKP